jgi:hypothetical protein
MRPQAEISQCNSHFSTLFMKLSTRVAAGTNSFSYTHRRKLPTKPQILRKGSLKVHITVQCHVMGRLPSTLHVRTGHSINSHHFTAHGQYHASQPERSYRSPPRKQGRDNCHDFVLILFQPGFQQCLALLPLHGVRGADDDGKMQATTVM